MRELVACTCAITLLLYSVDQTRNQKYKISLCAKDFLTRHYWTFTIFTRNNFFIIIFLSTTDVIFLIPGLMIGFLMLDP